MVELAERYNFLLRVCVPPTALSNDRQLCGYGEEREREGCPNEKKTMIICHRLLTVEVVETMRKAAAEGGWAVQHCWPPNVFWLLRVANAK